MSKDSMIQEILMAVNLRAISSNGTKQHADGNLFFSLVFRTEQELKEICKEVGIKIN